MKNPSVQGETGIPFAIAFCCDVDHAQRIGQVGFGSTAAKTGQARGGRGELVIEGDEIETVAVAVFVRELVGEDDADFEADATALGDALVAVAVAVVETPVKTQGSHR